MKIVRWVAIALVCILGLAGGFLALFGAAFFFSSPVILFVLSFVVAFMIAFGGARLVTRRQGRTALVVGIASLLLLALAFSMTLLASWPSTPVSRQSPPIPQGVQYWNLSTGSHIAYFEVSAQRAAKATPIIFVGGGPGEEDVADSSEVNFFGQLAQLGYNVYFYDQIGSGLSSRLHNPAQYTLARGVADLEAIRQEIGTEQVILMGSSWGGTLAANYMAAYPQFVSKAIFTSPAPIDYYEWSNFGSIISRLPPVAQKEANEMLTGSPRFLSWYVLGEINPEAVHNLVPDQKADSFFNDFLQLTFQGTVCDPSHLPSQPQQGNGFYDNIFTTRNADAIHPSANPITALGADHVPVLIMTGSCNYIAWPVEWQYKTTFPNSTLLYFPNAGHEIYLDQPNLYLQSIHAFLLDTPLPLQPWTSPDAPASCVSMCLKG